MNRLALLALALPASASVFDTYGFGARATSMANAHAAAAEDYTATYYNPAALTVHKAPHVGTGLNLVVPELHIDHEGEAEERPADELPETNLGVNLGLLFPLGGLIQNRFALGIGLYLPTLQATRVDGVAPTTPHFHRYNALPDKLVLALAGAFELHETVSVGVGLQVLGSLSGTAQVELDLVNQRFSRKVLEVDVHADTALVAGLLVRPWSSLRLAFSFRDELSIDYHLVTDVVLEGIGSLVADVRGTSVYTPQQYTWAAAWDPRTDLTLSFDLLWARWSRAPDPTARFDVRLNGAAVGFDEIEAESAPVDLGAADTLEPRLGVEWRPTEGWAVRGGYELRPTPLPAQTGRTSYLDSDAHQLCLGGGYSFPDPLAMHSAPITVDLTGQLTWLTERVSDKVDPDDPVGDLSAGGPVWHLALTFRHDFE